MKIRANAAVPYSQTHLGLTGNFKPGALKVGGQVYYSLGTAGNSFDANGDLEKDVFRRLHVQCLCASTKSYWGTVIRG